MCNLWFASDTISQWCLLLNLLIKQVSSLDSMNISTLYSLFSTVGDIMSTMGDILSTVEDVQHCGRYHDTCGEYHDTCGGYHDTCGGYHLLLFKHLHGTE